MKRQRFVVAAVFGLGLTVLTTPVFAQNQVTFRPPTALPLWLGVVVLGTIMIVFGVAAWWLFLSPLAEPVPPVDQSQSAVRVRRLIGALACVAGLSLAVALVWDEMWHRLYGGFGNDFLWPPHLLMYGSFLLDTVFACIGVTILMRRSSGSIRSRFRAEPALSLLGLVSFYEVASLPSDAIWHAIYGVDITAWSLPHLFIFGIAALMFLLACALVLSGTSQPGWQSIRHITGRDLVLVLLVGLANWIALIVGAVEYEWRLNPSVAHFTDATFLAGRPNWAYPVVIVAIGVVMSHFALRIVRKPGAATLTALLVLGARFAYAAVGAAMFPPGPLIVSHAGLVVPALVLDVWYAWRLREADRRTTLWLGIGLYWLTFVALVMPWIVERQAGPEVNSADRLVAAVLGLVLCFLLGTGSSALADWLRDAGNRQETRVLRTPQAAQVQPSA